MIPANAHLANLRAVHLRRESPALGLTGDFRNREIGAASVGEVDQLLLVVLGGVDGAFDDCVDELVVGRFACKPAAVEERSEQGCDGG
jgi:hypothetical protein